MTVQQRIAVGVLGISILALVAYIGSKRLSSNQAITAIQLASNVSFSEFIHQHLVFYDESTHRFRQVNETGALTELTAAPEPEAVAYDPTGQVVAVRLLENNIVHWQVLLLQDGKILARLDPGIGDLAFSSDGKRIAYEYKDGIFHNLSIANRDGQNWTKVLDLSENTNSLLWLKQQTYLLYYDGATGQYTALGLSGKQKTAIARGAPGILPSPSGQYVAIDSRDSNNATFPIDTSILTTNTDGITATKPIHTGSPSEWCGWDAMDDTLYCVTNGNGDKPTLARITMPAGTQTTVLSNSIVKQQLFQGQNGELLKLIGVQGNTLYYQYANALYQLQIN